MEGEAPEPDEPVFARSLREFAEEELILVSRKLQYELRAGDELVALLEDPLHKQDWSGYASDGTWHLTLKGRRGWNLEAFDSESDLRVAVYKRSRLIAGGIIEVQPGAERYRLRRQRLLGRTWELKRDGFVLVVVRSAPSSHPRASLEVSSGARSHVELELVLLLALSVIILEETVQDSNWGAGGA